MKNKFEQGDLILYDRFWLLLVVELGSVDYTGGSIYTLLLLSKSDQFKTSILDLNYDIVHEYGVKVV